MGDKMEYAKEARKLHEASKIELIYDKYTPLALQRNAMSSWTILQQMMANLSSTGKYW